MADTDIYDEIREERRRQDAEWGGPDHDDTHTVEEFVGFIREHAERGNTGYVVIQRKQMVRVAALAVAWIEKIDRDAARAAESEEAAAGG